MFISNRLISDNIVIGFEAFYWLQQHRKTSWQPMAVKLDISKAYEQAE